MTVTEQTTPQEALARLDGHALELDTLSSMLAQVQRSLEPVAPELLGRRDGLIRKRERIRERIGDLKKITDAERSILSALKETA